MHTAIIGHQSQLNYLNSLLKKDILPQTMLFIGPDGIGKTMIARHLARTFFCENENAPCGTCHGCLQVINETHPDFLYLGPNEKGKIPIGEDNSSEPGTVRWLIDRLSQKSVSGRQFVIIERGDVLRNDAQNAILKTIEEPPRGTTIIITTSNRSSLLPTILSRCSLLNFSPLEPADIITILNNQNIFLPNGDTIAAICGGSIANAKLLADNEFFNWISALIKNINSFVTKPSFFNGDITAKKELDTHHIIDILINIYSSMLYSATGYDYIFKNSFSELYLADIEKINFIIDLLLELKKELPNNINLKIALKGKLYKLFEGR